MGYYTNYVIELSDYDLIDDIVNRLSEISGYNWDSSLIEFCKWYDSEHDMCTLSKEFPDVIFTVYGDGESSDDIWCQYWKNGAMQNANRRIIYDEYDENKLIEWN